PDDGRHHQPARRVQAADHRRHDHGSRHAELRATDPSMSDTREAGRGSAPPFVVMEHVTKRFPGVIANDDVSLELRAGEVHALIGENGAGKSTLMRVLYGMYPAEEGRILLKGEEIKISSPRVAIANGIGMVHQHFVLVDPFS